MRPAISSTSPSRRVRAQGFTLVELVVIVAVIGIVSTLTLQSIASFLQEQKLRQAGFELAAQLQSARAMAQRGGGYCKVVINATATTISPSSGDTSNRCATASPALRTLNLSAVSGASGLTVSAASGTLPLTLTFTRLGTLATSATTPSQIIYLSASGTSQQRCVFLDLAAIRTGWRNGSTGACTYSSG